jgi:hypothetical protein
VRLETCSRLRSSPGFYYQQLPIWNLTSQKNPCPWEEDCGEVVCSVLNRPASISRLAGWLGYSPAGGWAGLAGLLVQPAGLLVGLARVLTDEKFSSELLLCYTVLYSAIQCFIMLYSALLLIWSLKYHRLISIL